MVPTCMLTEQYRMRPPISSFSNQKWYDRRLVDRTDAVREGEIDIMCLFMMEKSEEAQDGTSSHNPKGTIPLLLLLTSLYFRSDSCISFLGMTLGRFPHVSLLMVPKIFNILLLHPRHLLGSKSMDPCLDFQAGKWVSPA